MWCGSDKSREFGCNLLRLLNNFFGEKMRLNSKWEFYWQNEIVKKTVQFKNYLK
jgi:pterin-4a-carbinolamine dehydratase